jgi:topoisomerase IA-like protein
VAVNKKELVEASSGASQSTDESERTEDGVRFAPGTLNAAASPRAAKSTARKSTARKTTAKKTGAKKTTARKSAAKKGGD